MEPKEKAGKVCDFRARKRRAYWVRKRRSASRKALHNEPLKVPPLGREKPQTQNAKSFQQKKSGQGMSVLYTQKI